MIGAGGIYPPPDGYLDEVRRICREHDILFVADEVITGFGRIGGDWFASTRYGLEPDIMTTAKGLTSGYVPMGAVFVAPRVAEPFFDPTAGVWWRHGYTYGGHAAAAAAAMANLDIIEREDLLAASAKLETTLHTQARLLADHPTVDEVRSGTGAVAAVQLVDPAAALGLAKNAARARDCHPGRRRRRHPDLPGVRDHRRAGRRAGGRHHRRARLTGMLTAGGAIRLDIPPEMAARNGLPSRRSARSERGADRCRPARPGSPSPGRTERVGKPVWIELSCVVCGYSEMARPKKWWPDFSFVSCDHHREDDQPRVPPGPSARAATTASAARFVGVLDEPPS